MEEISGLINNLLSGSEQAWHKFVDEYGRYVWHCILRVANRYGCRLSAQDEQDLYQDVFTLLIEKGLKKFRGTHKPHLLAYIHRITIHHTINYLKKNKKCVSLEHIHMNWAGYLLILKDTESPCQEILHIERIAQLQKLLNILKPQEKQLLEMFYLDDMSPQEIAQTKEITVANFYVRKNRILNKLKNITLNSQMSRM
jgi:RNA polymerase sigma factor (sigma-70 family)